MSISAASKLDHWIERALDVIDSRSMRTPTLLSAAYRALSPSARSIARKFSPFRLTIIGCLRHLSHNATLPNENIVNSYRDKLNSIIEAFDLYNDDLHITEPSPTLVKSDFCCVIGRSLPEAKGIASLSSVYWQVIDEALSLYCKDQISNASATIETFSQELLDQIADVVDLAESFFPDITNTITENVSIILFVRYEDEETENGLISAHHPLVPNSFFLSRRAFSSMGHLLELIYHEALHNELESRILVESIYKNDFDPKSTPQFKRDWGNVPADNVWSFDRAMHAYYVYSHLSRLMTSIAGNFSLPKEIHSWGEKRINVTTERATLLSNWLVQNGAFILSDAGKTMVDFNACPH